MTRKTGVALLEKTDIFVDKHRHAGRTAGTAFQLFTAVSGGGPILTAG